MTRDPHPDRIAAARRVRCPVCLAEPGKPCVLFDVVNNVPTDRPIPTLHVLRIGAGEALVDGGAS